MLHAVQPSPQFSKTQPQFSGLFRPGKREMDAFLNVAKDCFEPSLLAKAKPDFCLFLDYSSPLKILKGILTIPLQVIRAIRLRFLFRRELKKNPDNAVFFQWEKFNGKDIAERIEAKRKFYGEKSPLQVLIKKAADNKSILTAVFKKKAD